MNLKVMLKTSLVHHRESFKGAMLANAKSVIVAHNNSLGSIEPSNTDEKVAEALVKAGKPLDMLILDHVIISSDGGYFSFRDGSLIGE